MTMRIKLAALSVAILGALVQTAWALPVFQVYSPGATAQSIGNDHDTWFQAGNSFDLIVVSSLGSKTISLEEITLIASVPQGETGTIAVTPSYGPDPTSGTYGQKSDFLPTGVLFNNHYPFQDDVSDFIQFDLIPNTLLKSNFPTQSTLHNYNADDGSTTTVSAYGGEYTYAVQISGFTSVHFDVYGYETDQYGKKYQRSTWEINPGSHDVTAIGLPDIDPPPVIPLPAAVWGGVALFGIIGSRRIIRSQQGGNVC